MNVKVSLIPALSDNYIHLLQWDDHAIVVDPAEALPVIDFLEQKKLKLKYIFNTHHHSDHTGGNQAIKAATACSIVGPKDERIPQLDKAVSEGEDLQVPPLTFRIFFVPGHTSTHIAFFLTSQKLLFSGDTLFTGSCGRLFEGTPEQMIHSLQKLSSLPNDTLIYCAHEYTQKNMEFANSLEPENDAVLRRLEKVNALRNKNCPTIPATLEEEKKTNPFLRVHEQAFKKNLHMENACDVEVFSHIRNLRNCF